MSPLPSLRLATLLASAASIAGCASLPSSGPTASEIVVAAAGSADEPPFRVLSLTLEAAKATAAAPVTAGSGFASLPAAPVSGAIGPGDTLQVSVFEVGAALFSSKPTTTLAESAPASAAGETLPLVTVGADGGVLLPYVGAMRAAGLTPDALAANIQAALAHKSLAPQVVVTVRENVANTVVVMGDVKKPGRISLTLARERVLDAIALAGGAANPYQDELVRLRRGEREVTEPLDRLSAGSADDVALAPQDRVELTLRPRTYTVFGATGKVSEVAFQNPRVSLAEAVARVGGPSDQQADPSAVFVFRYAPSNTDGTPQEGAAPVAYRLDLTQAQSYFLAQTFEMHPCDVIYIANARANQPTKLLQVLNLFFQPFYTAKVISQR